MSAERRHVELVGIRHVHLTWPTRLQRRHRGDVQEPARYFSAQKGEAHAVSCQLPHFHESSAEHLCLTFPCAPYRGISFLSRNRRYDSKMSQGLRHTFVLEVAWQPKELRAHLSCVSIKNQALESFQAEILQGHQKCLSRGTRTRDQSNVAYLKLAESRNSLEVEYLTQRVPKMRSTV